MKQQISEQQIKEELKDYVLKFCRGIFPISSKERIEDIINTTYNHIKDKSFCFDSAGHVYGCVRDEISRFLTPEELDNLCYWFVNRYLLPHKQTYKQALQEVKNGKKESHWMWWIFPQMKGLGKSERSQFYGIPDRDQARIFLMHPILSKHLVEITQAVYDSKYTPYEIFGEDVIKFRSCMLLFASIKNAPDIFKKVLTKNYWK